jgi:hypothetical protein
LAVPGSTDNPRGLAVATPTQVIPNNVVVQGRLSPQAIDIPANAVVDASISSSAKIGAGKVRSRYRKVYTQERATNAAVAGEIIHVVRGAAAELTEFQVGAVVAPTTGSSVTVDLFKNGVSILSSPVTVNAAAMPAAYNLVTGAVVGGSALVAGDVIEVRVLTAAAGAGALPKGLFAQAVIDEDPV